MPAAAMKKTAAASTAGELKKPKLASCDENPPRLKVENEWTTASNQVMPTVLNTKAQASVMIAYTSHRPLAVSVMRGVSLLCFIGPGVSALMIWLPPTPSSGRIATARTMMPMPPSHCSSQRQKLIDGGSRSSPDKTVEPVVVSAATVSKYASVKLRSEAGTSNGTVANAGSTVHT